MARIAIVPVREPERDRRRDERDRRGDAAGEDAPDQRGQKPDRRVAVEQLLDESGDCHEDHECGKGQTGEFAVEAAARFEHGGAPFVVRERTPFVEPGADPYERCCGDACGHGREGRQRRERVRDAVGPAEAYRGGELITRCCACEQHGADDADAQRDGLAEQARERERPCLFAIERR